MTFPHSAEDEEVVEWENAEVVETEAAAPVRDMSIRSVPPYQTPADELDQWAELLKGLKAERRKAKPEKDLPRVIDPDAPVQLSTSPKRYVAAAEALGMDVRSHAVLIWHPPVYQENDGKVRKDGSQVMAGDMKSPALEKVHLSIEARHPKAALGFQGFWVDGRFTEGFIHDPVGLPLLLEHEYKAIPVTKGKNETSASVGRREKQAADDAARWNATYNDGETWLVNSTLVQSGAMLDAWLDEWLERLAPDAKRLSRAVKIKEEPIVATEADLLGGAEWVG